MIPSHLAESPVSRKLKRLSLSRKLIDKHHMMATLFPIINDFNTQRSELWLQEAASQPNPRVEAASPPDN